MSNSAEVVFGGNAKGLLDEYKKMEKAYERQTQQLLAAMKVSRQTANEEKKLRQEVNAAIDKARTPSEAYTATINRYRQALQQGLITQQQYNKVRDAELRTLGFSKAALERLTAAEKENLVAKRLSIGASMEAEKSSSLMSGGFGAVTIAIGAATAGLKAFADEQDRIQEKSIGTVVAIDKMAREYAIQAGIPEDQLPTSRDKILEIAKSNAISPPKAFSAAKQMSSVGFDDPIGSGALDSFLKLLATSNLKEGDPAQLASSMAQFLGAYKQPINERTMLALGVRMRGLMAEQVEVSELADFAKAAPGFAAAKIPMDEALGLMAGMRNKMPAAEAATGIRNVLSLIQSAWKDNSNSEVLSELGLKPEDVDVVGESVTVALQRFKTAIDSAPAEKRAGYLAGMFGRENQAKAQVVLEGLDEMPRFIEMQKDTKGFLEGVDRAGRGPAATEQRTAITGIQADLKRERLAALRDMLNKESEAAYLRRVADIENTAAYSPLIKTIKLADNWFGDRVLGSFGRMLFNPEDRVSPVLLEEYRKKNMQTQEFTETDLRARMGNADQATTPALDPAPIVNAINRQTDVLSNKLTPPAKPTVNPNLQGRPKN